MSTSNDSRPRVVIVGAGFGGLTAARALARAPVRVTVVDRRNYHVFQPLLYQVATAELSPGDIAYPIRSVLKRQKNATVLLAEVTGVSVGTRRLELDDGPLPYDFLILATGARHSYFGHDDWEQFAPSLKSLEDALEIRRRILLSFERAERERDPQKKQTLMTFVLVGGGPTGAELAGAIAEISRHVLVSEFRSIDPADARIILLEAGPRLLPTFPPDLSERAGQSLEKLGVELRVNSPVTEMGSDFVVAGGRSVSAATILWCAGVTASVVARGLPVALDRAGRVPVAPDLSVSGHPEIFVIGDLAASLDSKGQPLPGVAQVAIQQGRHAARNIQRVINGAGTLPFHYKDPGNLAVIGRASAIADLPHIRFSGFPAWLFWCFVHIFNLIGFRNRFLVMFEWAWSYFSWQRGARLITGPPGGAPPKG